MTEFDGILEKISRELNIYRYADEDESVWKSRIVYSVMGKMALASLYDSNEEGESVSIQHLKNRIIEIFESYADLFPKIKRNFAASKDEYTDEIYKIYIDSGYIYHEPNRLFPAIKKDAVYKIIRLERGYSVGSGSFMCGLGTYSCISDGPFDIDQVFDMFRISKVMVKEVIDNLIKNIIWNDTKFDDDRKEYLRMSPPFSRGYWCDKQINDGRVSLMRVGNEGGLLYYLYKYENGRLMTSLLPSWMVDDGEYRNISNSILAKYGELPAIQIKENGNSVYIKQEYLLPPDILRFLRLYSWPCRFYKLPSDFERVMNSDIFEIFLNILTQVGIEVEKYV